MPFGHTVADTVYGKNCESTTGAAQGRHDSGCSKILAFCIQMFAYPIWGPCFPFSLLMVVHCGGLGNHYILITHSNLRYRDIITVLIIPFHILGNMPGLMVPMTRALQIATICISFYSVDNLCFAFFEHCSSPLYGLCSTPSWKSLRLEDPSLGPPDSPLPWALRLQGTL